MKQTSTMEWVPFKKCLVLLLTFLGLSFSQSLFANQITGYTASCGSGPVYSVTATATNVNSTSNYAWQYKNAAGTWICILNGNNTINGNVYSVSGATSTATTTPGPIKFNNPSSNLQGLVIRAVISNGAGVDPCTMPAGNTWNSGSNSVNFTINVTGTPCATPPDCSCVNSTSNLLTNPSFENGSTGWNVSGGSLTTGTGYVMCGAANGFLNWSSGTTKMWQDVTVAAGSVVTFKGYSGTHTPGISCSPKLSLLYLNATGGVILQSDVTVTKDVDVTGPALTQYTITGTAPTGTVTVRVQGSITCNTLKVDAFCLTVVPPSAVTNPDFNSTFVNVHVPGDVHTNDKVPTGTTYGTPTLVSSPSGSSPAIVMNSNGTYDFVSNVVGVYIYNVPVCVPGQVAPCPPTRLTITVLGPNVYTNAPVANVDIATTKMNTAVILRTLANDAAGNITTSLVPSSVTVTVAPLHGTTSINPATGDNTYTPATGYTGYDTLTYSVCDNQSPAKCASAKQIITIRATTASNTTAAADDYKITQVNTAATGNVKTNDTDPEGNTQTVATQNTTVAGKGTLVLAADGSYTFTPVTGYTGPVDFPYTTCDNGTPQACASATLHILVRPEVPYTNPDINTTFVNVHVQGDVHTNDHMPAGTTYGATPTLVSSPAGSTQTIVMNSDGTYDFVADKVGVYTYDVPVCTVSQALPCPTTKLVITVLDANSNSNAPVANVDIAVTKLNTPVTLKTLANDAAGSPTVSLVPSSVVVTVAPLHGTTSVNPATGDITYTPATGFSGSDTLTYSVSDNQTPAKSATAKQIISVLPANAPNTTSAADDYKITPLNTPATGNVKTNDTDPEGNAQTVATQNTTIAGKGNLALAADGSYTFTPFAGFSGPVDYPYTTCDNGVPQACASATLHILVMPAQNAPDLTPRITSNPNNIIGPSTAEITIQINEIKNVSTDGSTITLYVDKLSFFSNFTYNSARTSNSAGQSVQNSQFTIDATSDPDFYIIKSNVMFQNSARRLVFSVTVNPGQTKGSTPINVFLQNGSGGETVYTNNNDFTIITFSF